MTGNLKAEKEGIGMKNKRYSIGVDFGTLSGRAVLIDICTGEECAAAVCEYAHGVMSEHLPSGEVKLGKDWALQHPEDYLDVLKSTVPQVLKEAQVRAEDVVGIGIDFTSCTVLPALADGTPLCFLEEYKNTPHAYVKLWKHHAAQKEADEINRIGTERGETFLNLYGGKVSSEWMLPKVWQLLKEAPEIYNKAERFIEAGDWLVWQLTGIETRNSSMAGYKAMWNKKQGYPSTAFLKALDSRLEYFVEEKLLKHVLPIGKKAGKISDTASALTGLKPGTAVAAANIDAHVAVPTVGITKPGSMLMIMGTSTCHILLDECERVIPGICGVVANGVIEGYYGYEAGQCCVGDHFDWFVKNCIPQSYFDTAAQRGISIYSYLKEKAAALLPGESGLLALDWWNGNRSVLADADLTGLMVGMTLQTKPYEMYRALIEATAFGTKMIIDAFGEGGISIHTLYAAGGIAEKDELMMQIYADVTGMEIRIAGSAQAPAYGSAMFGAVAAGKENGGFDTIKEAAEKLCKVKNIVYKPVPENVEIYKKLYSEYRILSDYFGKGANDVMKRLKDISSSVEEKN